MNHEIKSNKKTIPRKPKNKIKLTKKSKTNLCRCLFELLQNFTWNHQQHFTKKEITLQKFPSTEKKKLLQQSPLWTVTTGDYESLKKGEDEKHLKHKNKTKRLKIEYFLISFYKSP